MNIFLFHKFKQFYIYVKYIHTFIQFYHVLNIVLCFGIFVLLSLNSTKLFHYNLLIIVCTRKLVQLLLK